jgi:hypothetical protein
MTRKEPEPRKTSEREYDFTLVLTGLTELPVGAEDALFEAGCDDSTISVRFGRVFLSFSRLAPSLKDAILSAIQDIKKANIGADVLRVDACDLVTQSDIARKIERSRQLVHQYVTGVRGPGDFPAPIRDVSDEAPLWSWCEVARWLFQNDMVKEDVVREATELAAINTVLDLEHQKRVDPALTAIIEERLRAVELPGERASVLPALTAIIEERLRAVELPEERASVLSALAAHTERYRAIFLPEERPTMQQATHRRKKPQPPIMDTIGKTKEMAWNEETKKVAQTDAQRILEAMIAEFGIEAAERALDNQGFRGTSYAYLLAPLHEVATQRRGEAQRTPVVSKSKGTRRRGDRKDEDIDAPTAEVAETEFQ